MKIMVQAWISFWVVAVSLFTLSGCGESGNFASMNEFAEEEVRKSADEESSTCANYIATSGCDHNIMHGHVECVGEAHCQALCCQPPVTCKQYWRLQQCDGRSSPIQHENAMCFGIDGCKEVCCRSDDDTDLGTVHSLMGEESMQSSVQTCNQDVCISTDPNVRFHLDTAWEGYACFDCVADCCIRDCGPPHLHNTFCPDLAETPPETAPPPPTLSESSVGATCWDAYPDADLTECSDGYERRHMQPEDFRRHGSTFECCIEVDHAQSCQHLLSCQQQLDASEDVRVWLLKSISVLDVAQLPEVVPVGIPQGAFGYLKQVHLGDDGDIQIRIDFNLASGVSQVHKFDCANILFAPPELDQLQPTDQQPPPPPPPTDQQPPPPPPQPDQQPPPPPPP